MKLKKFLLILGIVIISLIAFGLYKLSTFNLFDTSALLIEDIAIPNKGYRIRIYKIPSNATIQPSIQVRRIKTEQEEVLSNYERYDKLDSFSIKKDTLILNISNVENIVPPENIKFKLP